MIPFVGLLAPKHLTSATKRRSTQHSTPHLDAPTPTVMSDDGYVDTIDGVAAITRDAARRLADRLFYLGFLALPWLWVLNAWTFAPHVFASPDAKGVDPHVARRARASMWLGATAHVLLFAWALTFFLGGERVVGVAVWERFSVTTQEL